MKKYKNVIFDLDGTLIDTAPDIARCINIMLQKRSVPPLDIEIIRRFIGGGTDIFIKKLYETLKIPLTKDELSEEVRKYTDIYRMEPAKTSKLYDMNTASILASLINEEIKIGICTNKITEITETILKYFKIYDFFSIIVCGDSLPVKKPDPLPLLTTMKQMNAKTKDTLYVGDTQIDLKCCQLAKVSFIGVRWGMDKELMKKPIPFINNFRELVDIISVLK